MDQLLLTDNLFASLESSIISPAWLKGMIKRINSLTLMMICTKRLIGTFRVLKIMLKIIIKKKDQQKYPFSMNVSGQKHYCLMESSDCLSSTFSSSSSFHFYFISFRHSLLYCRQLLRKRNPKEKKSSCQPKLYSHTNYLPPTYTRHITS